MAQSTSAALPISPSQPDARPIRPIAQPRARDISADRHHAGNLHDRHQRNRGEVHDETGEGDARKHERADGQQRNLRAHRCDKKRGRRAQPRDAGNTSRSLRHADEDAKRRAERQRKAGVDDLQGSAQNRIAAVSAATLTGSVGDPTAAPQNKSPPSASPGRPTIRLRRRGRTQSASR